MSCEFFCAESIDFDKSAILKDLVVAASQQAQPAITDTSEMSIEQISYSVENEWTNYPLMRNNNNEQGVFVTFNDFKNYNKTNIPFKLTAIADSVYNFAFAAV